MSVAQRFHCSSFVNKKENVKNSMINNSLVMLKEYPRYLKIPISIHPSIEQNELAIPSKNSWQDLAMFALA